MINLTITNDIARIEINDGKANVISKEVGLAFIAALEEAETSAKATIVTGGGNKFCAGYDLSVIEQDGPSQMELVGVGFHLLYRLFAHANPLVAACNGHAIGLGAFILLCCDNRLGADTDFKVNLPETKVGMPLPPLLVTLLRARLNPQMHTAVALQSQVLSPSMAKPAGFLDELVAPDQLMISAEQYATALMDLPAGQYAQNKRAIRAHWLAAMKAELVSLGFQEQDI
jgi:enoyl-CoA hydratase